MPLGVGVGTLVLVGVVLADPFGGTDRPSVAPALSTTTLAPTTALPGAPPPAIIATTRGDDLDVYAAPDASSEHITTLARATDYGFPRTLLVVDQQAGWVQTLLPTRPNGSSGWVQKSAVTLSTTSFEIAISLERHELVLNDAGREVLRTPVVIGRPDTPTPLGLFYVTDPVDLTKDPSKVYGVYALGVSGFSEVLEEFQGGPAQIAVHGTPSTTDFGKDISNGCIRVANDTIRRIARLVPIGTPVVIEA